MQQPEPAWEQEGAKLKPNCEGPHDNSSFVPSEATIVTVRGAPQERLCLTCAFRVHKLVPCQAFKSDGAGGRALPPQVDYASVISG